MGTTTRIENATLMGTRMVMGTTTPTPTRMGIRMVMATGMGMAKAAVIGIKTEG
jgi:hypothetical protein